MALPNIFTSETSGAIVERIQKLTPETQPQWGKMTVAQMLAHCNVTYELVFEEGKHPKPGAFMKFILKSLVKKKVISETPYKQNGQTAPAFLITDERNFEVEKERLIAHINKTQQLGEDHLITRFLTRSDR